MFKKIFLKKISTSLIDKNNFLKKLNYEQLLPFLARINYERSYQVASLRGEYIGYKFNSYLENSIKNIKEVLNLDKNLAKKIAIDAFKKSSIEELEACIIAKKDKNFLKNYVEFSNFKIFKNALKQNKGIILAILHVGSFSSVLCKMGMIFNDVKFNAIAWDYTLTNCQITKRFISAKIFGMKYFFKGDFFFVGRINPKEIYVKLNNNKEVLIIAIDAPLGKSKFVEINFLNKKFKFPYTIAKLAYKTNSLIIPLTVYREGIKIIGKFFHPIYVSDNNYENYMQYIFSLLEKNIYEHPDEFFYWTSPTSWATLDIL